MAPFRGMFTAPLWQRVLVLLVGRSTQPRTPDRGGRPSRHWSGSGSALHQLPPCPEPLAVGPADGWRSACSACWSPPSSQVGLASSAWTTRWSDDGVPRSRHGGFTVIRPAPRTAHFVKASGLRWLSVMMLPQIPFAGRVWGLPFLTALAPSERYSSQRQRRHKKLTDWGTPVVAPGSKMASKPPDHWRCRQQLRRDRLPERSAHTEFV